MSFINVIRKRLLFLVLVVLGVSVITFAISHLIPGDPARLVAGDRASEEVVATFVRRWGWTARCPCNTGDT